jgi:hypothetical protein
LQREGSWERERKPLVKQRIKYAARARVHAKLWGWKYLQSSSGNFQALFFIWGIFIVLDSFAEVQRLTFNLMIKYYSILRINSIPWWVVVDDNKLILLKICHWF